MPTPDVTAKTKTGTTVSVETPVAAVTVEDPTTYYCGRCRPTARPVTLDPLRGYLCPIHGDGLKETK